jgi:hypothetical protein
MNALSKLLQRLGNISMDEISDFFHVALALAAGALLLFCLNASKYRLEYACLIIILATLAAAIIAWSKWTVEKKNYKNYPE